jgi:hypothetical protein
MTQPLPPDSVVTGWLHSLGLVSRCQWEVLVFLSLHYSTLLGAADLARLMGYASHEIIAALDTLEALGLVERSRVSQGARWYWFYIPLDTPCHKAFAQLQALAGHRAGRMLLAQQWRQDGTPDETPPQAKRFLADVSQRLHVHQRALKGAERRQQWLKAI